MADGSVSDACVHRDFIGNEKLRPCVVDAAKAYTFPPYTDGDFANIGLPDRELFLRGNNSKIRFTISVVCWSRV